MNIDVMQNKHRKWAFKNFGEATRNGERSLLGVTEELGELCHLVLKRSQKIRTLDPEDHRVKVQDAVGDIVMYLLDFCTREDIRISTCILQAWNEIATRDWVKYPKNGRDK